MPRKEDLILQALTNMSSKIDRHYEVTNDRLQAIEKVQVKQEENLGEHMRRTELAEKAIGSLYEDLKDLRDDEIAPLKKHKAFMEGGLKGIGLVATAVSVIAGLIKIISFFHH